MAMKSMPMDDAAMKRCMKSGKSHSQCMKQMGGKKMPMDNGKSKKSGGKKPARY